MRRARSKQHTTKFLFSIIADDAAWNSEWNVYCHPPVVDWLLLYLWGLGRMDAEQYLRRARRYLICARQMLNPVNRATMVDMAVIWMRMAEWAKPENRWPINRILKYEAFQPEHISVMGNVFEDVLRTIGLVDRQDPLAEKVAKKVIELAQTGDPLRLKELTLKAFGGRPN